MSRSGKTSIDLTPYPDLVVVYLGFRAQGFLGIGKLLGLGRGMREIRTNPPAGLLRHEFMLWGPMHVGIRQYWRDLPSLEAFTRSGPHAAWWREFAKGAGGTGFWHESYRRSGGMEGLYFDMPPLGLASFAEARLPDGGFKTARQRLAA